MSHLMKFVSVFLLTGSMASATSFTTYTDRTAFEAALDMVVVDTLDRPADIDVNGVTGDFGDYLVTADEVNTARNLLDNTPDNSASTGFSGGVLELFFANSGATISFDSPINGFGFDQFAWGNQASGGPTTLNILGESFLDDLAGFPSEAGFFGVVFEDTFTLVTIESQSPNDGLTLDNLSYGTTAPIPLPAGLPLLLAAAGSLGALRLRAHRQ